MLCRSIDEEVNKPGRSSLNTQRGHAKQPAKLSPQPAQGFLGRVPWMQQCTRP